MNHGKYVFAQIVEFIPQRFFDRIVEKYDGDKYVKYFSCWTQFFCMDFGQLTNSESLWVSLLLWKLIAVNLTSWVLGKALHEAIWLKPMKGGIKFHTLIDITTQIPAFVHLLLTQ